MTAQELFSDEIATPVGVKDITPKAKIKVIGVGGGGCNAVNYMHRMGIKGVEFAICNTDAQALEKSEVPIKIQIGKGLGAGMNVIKGREAATSSIEDLKMLFTDGTQMAFITTGMGGGTGTGAAPVVAQLAKEAGVLTIAIVTRPFKYEGKIRLDQADEGIEKMKEACDTVLVIANDKLTEMFGELPKSKAFANADDILSNAAKSIAEVITNPGTINIDFEDVNTVLKAVGPSLMGSAIGTGKERALDAITKALDSPLLDNHDISGAERILLSMAYSEEHEILMNEQQIITDYLENRMNCQADLFKAGDMFDNSLGESIRVTVIAAGFEEGKRKPIAPINTPKPEPTAVTEPIITEKENENEPTSPPEPTAALPMVDNYDSWQAAMKEAQDWTAYFRKYTPADIELDEPTYKRKNLQKFFIEESAIPPHLKVIEDLLA